MMKVLLNILIFLIQYSFECPRIISREEWGAGRGVFRGGDVLISPAFYWIIHQSKY